VKDNMLDATERAHTQYIARTGQLEDRTPSLRTQSRSSIAEKPPSTRELRSLHAAATRRSTRTRAASSARCSTLS
jgi:hypothetical protein